MRTVESRSTAAGVVFTLTRLKQNIHTVIVPAEILETSDIFKLLIAVSLVAFYPTICVPLGLIDLIIQVWRQGKRRPV